MTPMTLCLQLTLILLSMTIVKMNERFQYYQNYRLEKLCPPDGRKVRMRQEENVSSFQLNSSLVPGHVFNCHLELVLTQPDSGFFVYFDWMSLEQEVDGECEEDYVQFGRDILFITSHRSNKFCGNIEGSPVVPPISMSSNVSSEDSSAAKGANITPLDKRIYSEHSDTEMDIWIKVTVPQPGEGHKPKTLSLVVTPYKKSCTPHDRRYKRCGASKHCIRSELFCDGTVNCAVNTKVPQDENGCKVTTVPPVADTTIWEHPSLQHALGTCLSLGLVVLVLAYLSRGCWGRGGATAIPKENSVLGSPRDQEDLIHMDGLIVPVSRPRITGSRLAPPSYTDSVLNQSEQAAFQENFSTTRGFTPQYSYTNRL